MKLSLLGFMLRIENSEHHKYMFLNSRLMNSRQFMFLTKTKTIILMIPVPSLFNQVWNKEKGWQEHIPTKYNLFFVKLRKIFKK